MLSREEFKKCMNKIQESDEDVEEFTNVVGEYFEGDIFNIGFKAIDAQVYILETAMGEDAGDDTWISWYIYENKWGQNKFNAGYGENTKKIKNLDDLYNIFEEREKGKIFE